MFSLKYRSQPEVPEYSDSQEEVTCVNATNSGIGCNEQNGVSIIFGVIGMLVEVVAGIVEGVIYFDVFFREDFIVLYYPQTAYPVADGSLISKIEFVLRMAVAGETLEDKPFDLRAIGVCDTNLYSGV